MYFKLRLIFFIFVVTRVSVLLAATGDLSTEGISIKIAVGTNNRTKFDIF